MSGPNNPPSPARSAHTPSSSSATVEDQTTGHHVAFAMSSRRGSAKEHELLPGVHASRHQLTSGWMLTIARPASTHGNAEVDSIIDLEKAIVAQANDLSRRSIAVRDDICTTKDELARLTESFKIPPRPSTPAYEFLRWDFFSVYRKAFTLILTINLAAIILFLLQLRYPSSIPTAENAATAASANFLAAILFRNEHVVNCLFHMACMLPVCTPLSVRRRVAKVYSYGGVHSSCGVAGTMWYVVFAVLAIRQYFGKEMISTALAVTTGITLMLLLTILVFAHPILRSKLHNQFEVTHRYGGWTAVIVLWIQTMLLIISNAQRRIQTFESALVRSPPFWCLVAITALIIYPWTRLRSRPVRVERLSGHATRLHFNYTDMRTCEGIRLTDAPLLETHGFATIPKYAGSASEKGFSVLVSNAGDWTSKIINNPPDRLWVKGAPTIGVMRVALMFRKVLIVSTGSGIGPCLSLLQSYPDYPTRVLWSAQDPERTYGRAIIKSIFRSDPNAVIINTRQTGRPDMVAVAYALFKEAECEAAIIISNPKVTREIVFGLETRGIPAYGPIFDS